MVSLFAFMVTAYGMNPYLIASFTSGFACENAKTQILKAALEQNLAGTTTYAMVPRSLQCISTPGIVGGGSRPPEVSAPPRPAAAPSPVTPARKPVKK